MEQQINEYEIIVDYDPKKHDLVKTLEGFALAVKGELEVSKILSNLFDDSIQYSIELENISIGSVKELEITKVKKITKGFYQYKLPV